MMWYDRIRALLMQPWLLRAAALIPCLSLRLGLSFGFLIERTQRK